jgi:F-type H+-transporting ATPase subunit a
MMLLSLLQEHGGQAVEHAARAAERAAEAGGAGGHGEHVPWIVEQINHLIGGPVFSLQKQFMPQLYHLFGAKWPGEGLSFEQYLAAGEFPIPTQVVMFLIVVLITVGLLWFLRGKLSVESPTTRQQTFEVGVEAIRSLLLDLVGPHGLKYFPVVATFATLILFSNLLGLMPDMVAPTANLNVTLALGLTSFLYYNYVGIRENGLWGHIKHFVGPVPAIAFLMLPVELISHSARILSLSLRLFGNIFGDEQASKVISELVPWVVPVFLMPLALLVAVIQTFIFIVLSMIYLGEVTHHSVSEHGGHGAAAEAH